MFSDVMGTQTLGAATKKARFPKLSFILGTIVSCCEIAYLTCWSLKTSLLVMLLSRELQLSRRLLISTVDIVLALVIDM